MHIYREENRCVGVLSNLKCVGEEDFLDLQLPPLQVYQMIAHGFWGVSLPQLVAV